MIRRVAVPIGSCLGWLLAAGFAPWGGSSGQALASPTFASGQKKFAFESVAEAVNDPESFSLEFAYPGKETAPATFLAQRSADPGETPVYLRPNPRGRLRIPLRQEADFTYGFGSILQEPHALKGPTRDRTTTAQNDQVGDILIPFHVGARISDNQAILAEVTLGLAAFDVDLNYFYAPESFPGIFSANVISQRNRNPAFNTGYFGPEVNLPSGNDPWVHRWGGGVQYAYPFAEAMDLAVGVNYQRVSVRNGIFSRQVVPQDSQGNPLTVSPTGQDDVLTLNAAFLLDRVEGEASSVTGTRLRLGLEQSIPIGRANILYTRLTANGTQFIPLNLIRNGDYTDTLVLNLQGGVTLGEVPPYAPFNLGGIDTVRGYQIGAVAAGRHFLTATAEYQVPITTVTLLDYPLPIVGVAFLDYGTDFGTDDEVIGTPGIVRGKPGNGLGYGLGVQGFTPFGLLRLEYGFNSRGGSQIQVSVGGRF